ncbi:hypothetical protein KEM48_001055 [Puccinia striiformis f. sp. tritici PST-130]|nr:hypothetical protein KEM48_001055 [Puccinia striiformis f. sp. tritici PST-130]
MLVGNALGTQDLPGLGRHLDPVSALELTGESRHSSDSEHIARSSAIKTLARGDDLVPAGEEQRLLDFGPCYNGHHEVVIQIESGGKNHPAEAPIRFARALIWTPIISRGIRILWKGSITHKLTAFKEKKPVSFAKKPSKLGKYHVS